MFFSLRIIDCLINLKDLGNGDRNKIRYTVCFWRKKTLVQSTCISCGKNKSIKQKSQIRTNWLEMNPSRHEKFESKIYKTQENINILIKSKGDRGAKPRKWTLYLKCQCFIYRVYVCLCMISGKWRSSPPRTSFSAPISK